MISLIRRLSATGPTAKTASLRALQTPPLRERALTSVLLSSVIGPVYRTAVGEMPTGVPSAGALVDTNSTENRKSELVVEEFMRLNGQDVLARLAACRYAP